MAASSPYSGSSSALSSTMPWEWMLETCLDVKELSLPFLLYLIENVPNIEEPRCSRLLQKVALRYLADAVENRSVEPCDVALIRFFVKAEGLDPDTNGIHSLKEEFALDLVLRIETEAALRTLRAEFVDGGRKKPEAFALAVRSIFPSETDGSRGAERRKELLAILPRRPGGEVSKERCDELLRRFSFEELLKDVAKFVEDRKKSFNFKFLDQLARDVRSGAYTPVPPPISDVVGPGARALRSQGVDETLPGPGAEKILNVSSKVDERVPGESAYRLGGEAHPDLMSEQVSRSPSRNAAACQGRIALTEKARDIREGIVRAGESGQANNEDTDLRAVERGQGNDENPAVRAGAGVQGNDENPAVRAGAGVEGNDENPAVRAGAGVGTDEDPVADLSDMFEELAELPMGMRNGVNEIVSRMTKFAGETRSKARMSTFASTPRVSPAHNAPQTSERVPMDAEFGVEENAGHPRRDHDGARDRNEEGIFRTRAQEWMAGGGAEEETEMVDVQDGAHSPTRSRVARGWKRVSIFSTDGSKKAKYAGGMDSDYLGLRHQGASVQKDPEDSRSSPIHGHRSAKLPEVLGTHRTRAFLGRESKDRTGSLKDLEADEDAGEAVSRDERQQAYGESRPAAVDKFSSRRGSARGEHLPCEQGDDASRQVVCHDCLELVHECCLANPSMTRGFSSDNSRYCFPCASRLAKECLRKDEEVVSRADDVVERYEAALKVAEENLRKVQENLRNARTDSEKAKERSVDSKDKVAFFASDAGRGLCEHRQLLNDSAGQGRQANVGSPQSRRRASSHPVQPQESPQRRRMASSRTVEPQESPQRIRRASSHAVYPQKSPQSVRRSPQRVRRASPHPVDPQESPQSVRRASPQPVDPQESPENERRASSHAVRSQEGASSHSRPEAKDGENLTASVHAGRSVDGRDGASSPVAVDSWTNHDSNQAAPIDIVDLEVDGGDGRGRDPDEDPDKVTASADRSEASEQPEDTEFSVPRADARPRRGRGPIFRPRGQIPGVRRKHLPWTPVEELILRREVMKYSHDGKWGFQWTRILEAGAGDFHESRTAVDLKDKWRNMMKSGAAW